MKDPALAVKAGYFARLDGLEVGDMEPLKLYDGVDQTASFPYLYFGSVNASTAIPETKFNRGFQVSVQIQIVTAFKGNSGGFIDAETISQAVTETIGTHGNYIEASGFNVITTVLESGINIAEPYQSGMLFKRILTFSHQIAQTTTE